MAESITFGTEEYAADDQGRCQTCGFFGRFDMLALWLEASREQRHEWSDLGPTRPDGRQIWVVPACIVGAVDLSSEWRAAEQAAGMERRLDSSLRHSPGDIARPVIERDRHCQKWFPYQPGWTPSQHVEMFHVIQIEESRRQHELLIAQIEAESRRASERTQADSPAIANAVQSTAEATGRFTTRWTYVAALVAIVGLVMVLLAYYVRARVRP